jgi:multiple sugar transport system permease protein
VGAPPAAAARSGARSVTALRARLRRPEAAAWLFVAPGLILFLVFRLYPLFSGLRYSFTAWNGITSPVYVGLRNYTELFGSDPTFRAAIVNALTILATLPVWVGLPLILAILIYLKVPGGGFFRAAYFVPVVLSSVIIGTMFNIILRFDGVFNVMLQSIGIDGQDWIGDRGTALFAVISVAIWSHFGMSVLIFLSGLATFPGDVIEAARIDGASLTQIILRIIVPLLYPMVRFVTVITTITMLTAMFGLIYVMTQGGPGTATYVPEYLIWLMQGDTNRLGYAAAVGMVLFVFVGGCGLVQIAFLYRTETEE